MSESVCPECGAGITPYAGACWMCGAKLPHPKVLGAFSPAGDPMPVSQVAKFVGVIALVIGAVTLASGIALFTLCLVAIR